MKHFLCILLLLAGFLAPGLASADTEVIEDGYYGYYTYGDGETNYGQRGGDVIALNPTATYVDKFDVTSMIVDINSDGNVSIKIVTDYQSGTYGTTYGDLFIDVDGWDENAYSSYSTTGTNWDYVFDTSSKNSIYSLTGANEEAYLLSQYFFGEEDGTVKKLDDNEYRKDQLVQVDTNELSSGALLSDEGTFDREYSNLLNSYLLIYTFNLEDLGLDLEDSYDLAFRWTMTCANDVIEGSVSWQPVPEPETMVMLGVGLLGLGALGRRRLSPVRIRSKRKAQ